MGCRRFLCCAVCLELEKVDAFVRVGGPKRSAEDAAEPGFELAGAHLREVVAEVGDVEAACRRGDVRQERAFVPAVRCPSHSEGVEARL